MQFTMSVHSWCRLLWQCIHDVGCYDSAYTMWVATTVHTRCGLLWQCIHDVGCYDSAYMIKVDNAYMMQFVIKVHSQGSVSWQCIYAYVHYFYDCWVHILHLPKTGKYNVLIGISWYVSVYFLIFIFLVFYLCCSLWVFWLRFSTPDGYRSLWIWNVLSDKLGAGTCIISNNVSRPCETHCKSKSIIVHESHKFYKHNMKLWCMYVTSRSQ